MFILALLVALGGFAVSEGRQCSFNPCHNGGSCVVNDDGYACVCPPGYKGSTCYEANAGCQRRVCYYDSAAKMRQGMARLVPEDIDPHLCTHVIFKSLNIQTDHLHVIDWDDEDTAWNTGMYHRFTDLKLKNPDLKVMIVVSAIYVGSAPFTHMVSTAATRKDFIDNAIKFLRDHNFDGLDFDWQYPGISPSPPGDRHRFTLLVEEFRAAIRAEAAASGKDELLLTAFVSGQKAIVDTAYEVAALSRALDFMTIDGHHMHHGWDGYAAHNAPLYEFPGENNGWEYLNQDYIVHYYIQKGVDPQKLVLGLSTYGITYKLRNPLSQSGPFSPTIGGGTAGPYTLRLGWQSYYEVCARIKAGASVHYIPSQQVPYAVDGNEWIGFNNEDSIRNKVRYILDNNLGGVGIWNIDLDDFSGTACGAGPYPLINAARDQCGNYSNTPVTNAPTTSAPTTSAPTTSAPTTSAPTINAPTTSAPTTSAPTTLAPTTIAPATSAPTSATTKIEPKTSAPTTVTPTRVPTTIAPTSAPTPIAPTTSVPTTVAPTSTPTPIAQTTRVPTTSAPDANTPLPIFNLLDACKDLAYSDGVHADPTSCDHFLVCTSGQTTRLRCPGGAAFNPAVGNCQGDVPGCPQDEVVDVLVG